MTSKENLLRLIDQLPPAMLVRLEERAIALLAETAGDGSVPAPGQRMSFDEALGRTNEKFEEALQRLAD